MAFLRTLLCASGGRASTARASGSLFRVFLVGLLLVAELGGLPRIALAQSISAGDPIQEIRIEGSQRIEPDTVRSYMAINPGDPFDAKAIDRALKNLFATGLFADVNFRREGGSLIVQVTENPIINRIAFEGNDKLDDDQLQTEIQLRPRVVYTQQRVQSDVKRLLDLYRRNGRFAATVDPKVIKLDQNRVDLVFEINEGDTTDIERIDFVGNKVFDDDDLRDVVITRESAWFRFLSNSDTYDPDRLTVDKENLRKFYLEEGYADFRVVSAVAELSPDQEAFFITFTVDEGERYKLGKVEIKSTLKDLDPNSLWSEVQTADGDWYNATLVDKTVQAIANRVGSLGYAFVDVRPRIKRDAKNHVLDLTYDIQEGPKVYVERIDITGNIRTQDKVIRREFRLAEGDAFSTTKMKRTEQRLRNLGFFEAVDIQTTPGSAPDKTIIKVKVAEQSTGEFTFGAGFSTADGPLGNVGIRERNLLGKGQDLRANFTLSGKRSTLDVSFTDPYFLDKDLSAGVDLFHRRYNDVRGDNYDLSQTGFGLRMGYELTEFTRQTLGFRVSGDKISDVDKDLSQAIKDEKGWTLRTTFSSDIIYDKRDNANDPRDGYFLSLSNDLISIRPDFTDEDFNLQTLVKGGYFYPVTDDISIGLSAEAGYIQALGGGHVRVTDAFTLGGQNLRGFETSGVGPRDADTNDSLGGQFLFDGTLQASFPVGLPEEFNVRGRAFTDFGTLTGTDLESDIDIDDDASLRVTAGLGLTWVSPFGPIAIDVAYPLMKESYDNTEWFRFSVGTSF
ncbi:outer membrane protein assembly factor BamA [Dongia rigui]|uniref:Outer membrane protein assembly factor BamA n=1 Tax=Dongia rigui TaxID=940149 RepID=A0ABU5DSL0_9PROT|nr:outer membrane protein assembly factor BamA [Dongia rigui]MDY0870387.1 outer membrane protein assembly factor BamA [Dongia rigui]